VCASVARNEDPVRWGYREVDFAEHLRGAVGFPVCRATVEHHAEGYARLLGWVQTVWTDEVGEFDPWAQFHGLDMPYCWFGFEPELFDTPWRADRARNLEWVAHSWLCGPAGSLLERDIKMLTGFRWGYRLHGGEVVIEAPSALNVGAWKQDVPILQRASPSWTFRPGKDETVL
jgi:hypothetical protein